VTATFTPILHTLTVMRSGAGSGTVTSAPTGINCGADCVEDYAQGAMVTLTAAPSAGSTFIGWSGAGCTGTGTCAVTMTAATTVTATFTAMTVTLTVAKAGTGAGTVTSSPAGINCGADCTEAVHRRHRRHAERRRRPRLDVRRLERRRLRRHRHLHGDDERRADRHRDVHAQHLPGHRHQGRHRQRHRHLVAGRHQLRRRLRRDLGHGTMVTLTATARGRLDVHRLERRWLHRHQHLHLTVTAATAVTATFTANQVTLTVAKTGAGAGTVTLVAGRHQLRRRLHRDRQLRHDPHAVGDAGRRLDLQRLDRRRLHRHRLVRRHLTGATTVTADFALAPFALTVTKAGTGAGTVTSSPAGINCGADCTEPTPTARR
jgi:hypothetical protein